ncbi:tyrosine-type recombinase/integrase [Pannonibacter sp. Q-1]|uniref:tyrosine-type recombinase/integrase n=1 Tax=Pannonibacter indicus TaxID=466044 RepID=UPI0035AEF038
MLFDQGLPKIAKGCFPGDAEGKHLQNVKLFWEDWRAKAELPSVRIHDLNHTFASLQVSGGMTLPMIGKLLCHLQIQTTQRYAHLLDEPLRAKVEHVDQLLNPTLEYTRLAELKSHLTMELCIGYAFRCRRSP